MPGKYTGKYLQVIDMTNKKAFLSSSLLLILGNQDHMIKETHEMLQMM